MATHWEPNVEIWLFLPFSPHFWQFYPIRLLHFEFFHFGEISQVRKRVGVNLKLPYWPNSVHTGEWSCVVKGHCQYERVRVHSSSLRFRKLDGGGRVSLKFCCEISLFRSDRVLRLFTMQQVLLVFPLFSVEFPSFCWTNHERYSRVAAAGKKRFRVSNFSFCVEKLWMVLL
jgi:hypothetical protein